MATGGTDSLVIDNRPSQTGLARGAIHALVIGVSYYSRPISSLRLPSREGPALAAHRFASYLVDEFQTQDPLNRPLGTLRLLLSPMPRNREGLADRADLRDPPPVDVENVENALHDWAIDCNSSPDNLGVFYAAGHGVYGRQGATLFLLPEAPARRWPGAAAIDLAAVEEQMADCAATQNLYIYDCCAVQDEILGQSRAISLHQTLQDNDGLRRGNEGKIRISAAKAGTETYALGTRGTLLSQSLLGEYADRAGNDALLRIAGELDSSDRRLRRGRCIGHSLPSSQG